MKEYKKINRTIRKLSYGMMRWLSRGLAFIPNLELNKISKAKKPDASGQGSHWLIEIRYSYICNCYEIFVNFVFQHIHDTSIYTISRTCVPFTYLSL